MDNFLFIFWPDVAQLLEEIRNVSIGIVFQPQPYHDKLLVGIHIENLPTDAHSIITGELWLFSPYTTGIVPTEMVAFIVFRIIRRLLNP